MVGLILDSTLTAPQRTARWPADFTNAGSVYHNRKPRGTPSVITLYPSDLAAKDGPGEYYRVWQNQYQLVGDDVYFHRGPAEKFAAKWGGTAIAGWAAGNKVTDRSRSRLPTYTLADALPRVRQLDLAQAILPPPPPTFQKLIKVDQATADYEKIAEEPEEEDAEEELDDDLEDEIASSENEEKTNSKRQSSEGKAELKDRPTPSSSKKAPVISSPQPAQISGKGQHSTANKSFQLKLSLSKGLSSTQPTTPPPKASHANPFQGVNINQRAASVQSTISPNPFTGFNLNQRATSASVKREVRERSASTHSNLANSLSSNVQSSPLAKPTSTDDSAARSPSISSTTALDKVDTSNLIQAENLMLKQQVKEKQAKIDSLETEKAQLKDQVNRFKELAESLATKNTKLGAIAVNMTVDDMNHANVSSAQWEAVRAHHENGLQLAEAMSTHARDGLSLIKMSAESDRKHLDTASQRLKDRAEAGEVMEDLNELKDEEEHFRPRYQIPLDISHVDNLPHLMHRSRRAGRQITEVEEYKSPGEERQRDRLIFSPELDDKVLDSTED